MLCNNSILQYLLLVYFQSRCFISHWFASLLSIIHNQTGISCRNDFVIFIWVARNIFISDILLQVVVCYFFLFVMEILKQNEEVSTIFW